MLIYEYATRLFEGDTAKRCEATRALNISFQYACFAAVGASLALLAPLGGEWELGGGETENKKFAIV